RRAGQRDGGAGQRGRTGGGAGGGRAGGHRKGAGPGPARAGRTRRGGGDEVMSRLERTRATVGRAVAWLLPDGRRDWIMAVWAEAHDVPPGLERLAWRAGGVWMLVREALMPRRILRATLFGVAAAVAAWTAWPDSSVLHAAADRFGVIATVLLLAGLPLLALRFIGPVGDGWAARFLRVGG